MNEVGTAFNFNLSAFNTPWCVDDTTMEGLPARIEARLAFIPTQEHMQAAEQAAKNLGGAIGASYSNQIAIIPIKGTLIPNASWYDSYFGFTGYNQIRDIIEELYNEGVRTFVLKVFCGGGSWLGQTPFTDFLYQLAQMEDVVLICYIDEFAASAAVAALVTPCQEVWAGRNSEIGSLGTLAVHRLCQQEGTTVTVVRADDSDEKALVNSNEPLDAPDGKPYKALKASLNESNDRFLENIVRNRPVLNMKQLKSWRGRMLTAQAAVNEKLIDKIGSFEELITHVQETQKMNELLKLLGASNETACVSKVNELQNAQQELTALRTQLQAAGFSSASEALEKLQIYKAGERQLVQITGHTDLNTAIAACAGYKSTAAQVPGLQQDIAALKGEGRKNAVQTLLAENDSKLNPERRAFINSLVSMAEAAQLDPVPQVKAYLDSCNAIVSTETFTPPEQRQRNGQVKDQTTPPSVTPGAGQGKTSILNDEEMEQARSLGITNEQFIANFKSGGLDPKDRRRIVLPH